MSEMTKEERKEVIENLLYAVGREVDDITAAAGLVALHRWASARVWLYRAMWRATDVELVRNPLDYWVRLALELMADPGFGRGRDGSKPMKGGELPARDSGSVRGDAPRLPERRRDAKKA